MVFASIQNFGLYIAARLDVAILVSKHTEKKVKNSTICKNNEKLVDKDSIKIPFENSK